MNDNTDFLEGAEPSPSSIKAEDSASLKSKDTNSSSKASKGEETDSLPKRLFVIPLQGRLIFPGIFTPLMITGNDDIHLIEEAYSSSGFIGLAKQNVEENPVARDLCKVGTVARIMKKINLPDGGLNIFISTVRRYKSVRTIKAKSPITLSVEYPEETDGASEAELQALTRALVSEMKEVSENNPLFSEEMRLNMVNIDSAGKTVDFIASILNITREEQQELLETFNVRERIEKVLTHIKREQEVSRMQKKIQNELNERVDKQQREFFLREEMKSIQEELGVNIDGGDNDYQKFKKKIDEFGFTGEVKEAVESELEKLFLADPSSPDYFTCRNYLDLVVKLPWKDAAPEAFNLYEAKNILEADHYGLEDVKKRIIEYIAVRKMKQDSKGAIIILVGPPGVGKTSVGKSIAKSMKKPFYRFSVGGMKDEAEIKGHRRTYVGAMAGKIIQGLKITHSKSPVFMIDEVDKMGESAQGDPASALLEVLDPEQNVNFRDNYLDLPFDVSNVLFILTANSLNRMLEPLLDRAEIIELSGYIDSEKIEIAKKSLIPKNLEKNGLSKKSVKYTEAALKRIAEEYAREAGVRNYEKCLDKIHRKIVTLSLKDAEEKLRSEKDKLKKEGKKEEASKLDAKMFLDEKTVAIDAVDLEKYLDEPVFDESEVKRAIVPGTAIGLAWTSMGGDTLLLESLAFLGKGELILTGRLGDVMKESATIALDWVKNYVLSKGIKDVEWFKNHNIHLHIPEGATPKDGPSAGITMATAFISLFTERVIKEKLAMTGELSLTGRVLPIGGLREKTVAAKRNGIKTILIPEGNKRDLKKIPEHVKNGISFIPVKIIEEVIENVF